MARYCIAFDTVQRFSKLKGTESLEELVCDHLTIHKLLSKLLCTKKKINPKHLRYEHYCNAIAIRTK